MPTYVFAPDRYYTAIGTYEPALAIRSGDTVVTTTVNAAGEDATGRQVTPRGNPMTGPFLVEGAEPGDVLEVAFHRIEPAGATGYTYDVVAANVVDPAYVRELPVPHKLVWRLDHDRRIVAPAVDASSRLHGLELPFEPMIGCFGVAPARGQAISTATSAEHGGNMDYRGFRAGTVARFPVFVEGALFFLGDVHACQGDGEVVGTGVEVPAEVEFTLTLRKGRSIGWPRGEDEAFVFTVGNARPLDQAVQHATTEMLTMLRSDYGLDLRDAGTLLGQCVRYEIGNVFDPAFTAVCKMPKEVLERLGTLR